MSRRKEWKPSHTRQLSRLRANPNLTMKEIAAKMGFHYRTIQERIKKPGVSPGYKVFWTEEYRNFLRENFKYGRKYCAEQLGFEEEAVRKEAARLRLYTPRPVRPAWSEEEDQIVLQRREAGVLFSDIGYELGRTQEAVRYRHKVLRGVIRYSKKKSKPTSTKGKRGNE